MSKIVSLKSPNVQILKQIAFHKPVKNISNLKNQIVLSEVLRGKNNKKCHSCNQTVQGTLLNVDSCNHGICVKCLDVIKSSQDELFCPLCTSMDINKNTKSCAHCNKEIFNDQIHQPSNSKCKDNFCEACIQLIRNAKNDTKCQKCNESITKESFQHVKQRSKQISQLKQCPQCMKDVKGLTEYSCKHQQCLECHRLYGNKCSYIACNRKKYQKQNLNNKSSNDLYQDQQFHSSNRAQQATYGVNKSAYQVERILTDEDFLKTISPQRSVLLSVHQLRNVSDSSIDSFSKLFLQKSLPYKVSGDSITPNNLRAPLIGSHFKSNSNPMKFIQKIQSHQPYSSYQRKDSQDLDIKRLDNEDREIRLFGRVVSQEKKQSDTYSRAYLSNMANQSYVQDQPLLKYQYKDQQQKSSQIKCDICLQPQQAQSIFLNTKCNHKWCIDCVLKRPHDLKDQNCYITNCGKSINEVEFTLFYDQRAKLQTSTINILEEQNQQENLSNTQCEICKQKQPFNLIFMNSKCKHKWCFDCIAAMQGQNNNNSCCIWKCRSPLNHTEMDEFYQNICVSVIKEKERIKSEENNNSQTLAQVPNNNNNENTYNIIILFNQQEIELSVEINNLKVGMKVAHMMEEALKNKKFILKKPQMFIMLGKLAKIPLSNEMKVVDILKIYPDKKTLLIKEQQS